MFDEDDYGWLLWMPLPRRPQGTEPWVDVDHYGSARYGFIADVSLLGAFVGVGFTDYTPLLDAADPIRYAMDLTTPGGTVRVPISSWQATLQVAGEIFASCVVPGAGEHLDELGDATEFVIWRTSDSNGHNVEQEMVRSTLQTLQVDRGPTNYTASLSGYDAAYPAIDDPDPIYDRTLTGMRTITTYTSGRRVRCAIDWLLRPGQRALYDAESFVVAYINYYANGSDEYMDVGERIA